MAKGSGGTCSYSALEEGHGAVPLELQEVPLGLLGFRV